MRKISFTKMHGLGNDFVMLNAFKAPIPLSKKDIQYLGHRHLGIGFDQLLVVEPPSTAQALFKYRIYNADGSEVEQCGNGARCFARFVIDEGLTQERSFPVETLRGIITPHVEDDGQVTVNMGTPRFDPASLPFNGTPDNHGIYTLPIDIQHNNLLNTHSELSTQVSFRIASMGNPHVIIRVPSVAQAPLESLGAWLSTHSAFPNHTNVEFIEIIDQHTLRMRVYERGVGETLACGTGACAAAAIGLHTGELKEHVTVHMTGGSLHIHWAGGNAPLFMTGPAVTVFRGECFIPEL